MINRRYFKTIDNETKAYWLGFIIADGGLAKSGKQITIQLSAKDKNHLQKLANIFGKKISTGNSIDKKRDKTYYWCKLVLHSTNMFKDITNKGVPRKKALTKTDKVFDHIPNQLKNHFIRGIFDGDGSFGKYIDWKMTIVGEYPILEKIRIIFSDLCQQSIPTPVNKGGCYRMTVSCIPRLSKIKYYLYHNATVFLERKRNRWYEMPSYRGTSKHKGIHWCNTKKDGLLALIQTEKESKKRL